ncbi:hypothetical protein [Candidatus Kuenenia sp.]
MSIKKEKRLIDEESSGGVNVETHGRASLQEGIEGVGLFIA